MARFAVCIRRGPEELMMVNDNLRKYELGWCTDSRKMYIRDEDTYINIDSSNQEFIDYVKRKPLFDLDKPYISLAKLMPVQGTEENLLTKFPKDIEHELLCSTDTNKVFIVVKNDVTKENELFEVPISGYIVKFYIQEYIGGDYITADFIPSTILEVEAIEVEE